MDAERPVEYLDTEDLVELAHMLLGGNIGIRDVGLLHAAAARAQTTVAGDDAYPDLWTKSAALLQSLVKGQALLDGNKRLGWLATAVFLEVNGVAITTASNEDVYDLVIEVASGTAAVEEIAQRLRSLIG